MKILRNKILILLIFSIVGITAYSQNKYPRFQKPGIPMVCYGDNRVAKTFVPPPNKFLKSLSPAADKSADIIVTYNGFTSDARKAFQQAVDIWETLIESPVPIYMEANWEDLGETTLGSCVAGNYYLGLFLGARLPLAYYPLAVAEKMAKSDINLPGEPDLIANFSSTASWYYGSDGQTPVGTHDLVSVVMHEIAHGIGFIGTMGLFDSNTGAYGDENGLVIAYDEYIENLSGIPLVDTTVYDNPSNALYQAMTSGALYYNSPVTLYNNANTRPKLWAPGEFAPGSSIYHLDEFKYSS
ncbi:MAG: hypothetical protein QNK30_01210, partial [Bacteroidales bacterium]|nr:hypothetical protein [Bacteroidales bacterium]